MTASDETGWEFGTVQRTYANTGLNAAGGETIVAWEIVRLSPRSTAFEPEEVRRETLTFPVGRSEARVFTVRARMLYRFAPAPGAFAGEGPSVLMAEQSTTMAGGRAPRRPRP